MCEKKLYGTALKKQLKINIMNTSKYFMQTIQFLSDLKDKKRSNI
jgi:hypothetical protein